MSVHATRTQLCEQVSAAIADQIASRAFAPDAPLPSETALAARFNVSKTVVREALGRLAARGMVLKRQGRPTVVAPLTSAPLLAFLEMAITASPDGLRDALALRAALEREIAAAAALRATKDDLAEFDTILQAMEQTLEEEELYVRNDLAFHMLLARCSGNRLMHLLMEGLSGSIAMNIRMLHRRRDLRDTRGTLPRHEAIVRAIRVRDPEAARAAVQQHFAASSAVAQAMADAEPIRP